MDISNGDWQALKKWHLVEKEIRKKIVEDAFCTFCRGAARMIKHEVIACDGYIAIKGRCYRCGGPVTKIIG